MSYDVEETEYQAILRKSNNDCGKTFVLRSLSANMLYDNPQLTIILSPRQVMSYRYYPPRVIAILQAFIIELYKICTEKSCTYRQSQVLAR